MGKEPGTKTITSGLLVVTLMFALFAVGGCSHSYYDPNDPRNEFSFPISVAKKDVQVLGACRMQPYDEPLKYSLRLASASGSMPLTAMTDLKGMVQINNAQDALTFVRLRTSLSTYIYWPGDWTVELCKSSEKMETFGQSSPGNPTGYVFGPPPPGPSQGDGPGYLDDDEFDSLGYSLPRVSMVGSKFVVTRWLLVCSPDNRHPKFVEKVKEYVGSDGDYSMTILKRQDVSSRLRRGVHYFEWVFLSPSQSTDIS